jgi:hypothetical protein
MDIPARQDVRDLLSAAQGDAISIYLPTHRQKEEAPQDPARLKNLLRRAEQELLKRGRPNVAVRKYLAPARALVMDHDFWKLRTAGLAIFLADGLFRYFRLPTAVDEQVVVARRFTITPLVPLLTGDHAFYVLAVSQKHVQLLWGDRFSEHVIPVDGLPTNLAEALNYQQPHHMYQAHLFVGGPRGLRLKQIHGQGGASDFAKEEISEYFRLIDQALHPFLRDRRLPLIFAGVDHLFPIYREVNTYPHLEDVHVHGSPDLMSHHELHALAWELIGPRFEQPQHEALRRACQRSETDTTIFDSKAVLRAACEGRVDTLFLAPGEHEWGTIDPDTGEVHTTGAPSEAAEELFNRAAIETLLHGGQVYLVQRAQMPQHSALAAVYRYAAAPQSAVTTAESGPH